MVRSSSTSSSRPERTELAFLMRRLLLFTMISMVSLALIDWRLRTAYLDAAAADFSRAAAAPTQDHGIVLGASHVKSALNPVQLRDAGATVYNHALFGASPSYVLQWYVGYYRKLRPPPRFAIVGVSTTMFDPHLMRRQKIHDTEFYPTEEVIHDLAAGEYSAVTLLQHWLPLLKYRVDHKRLLGARGERCPSIEGYTPLDGVAAWQPRTGGLHFRSVAQPVPHLVTDPAIRPSAQLVANFEALLDRLASDGVAVLLMSPPVLAPRLPVADGAEPTVRRIARERNLTFLDYNHELHSELNSQMEYFYDAEHLNFAGGEIFSRRVSGTLRDWLRDQQLND